MDNALRCPMCKKPVIPNRHTIIDTDEDDKPYILCPWSNCQTKLFLPVDQSNGASNPGLHEQNRHSLRDPVTGRFVSEK
jgi:hypothetical protein